MYTSLCNPAYYNNRVFQMPVAASAILIWISRELVPVHQNSIFHEKTNVVTTQIYKTLKLIF